MASEPRYRIMAVDDDADVRFMIAGILGEKYEVVQAHDGLDALEKLDQYEPDFVIMDMVMPLVNGLEACEAIRRNPRFKSIQVLFLSAYGSRENISKSYQCGGNLFLSKPIEPERLLKNVDMFFESAPPPLREKRMSLRQIQIIEKSGQKMPKRPDQLPKTVSRTPRRATQPTLSAEEKAASQPAEAGGGAQPSAVGPTVDSTVALVPRVLVVEDDKEMAELVTMGLSDAFEVVVAIDGLDAVEKVVKYQPDLLVLDIMMPKMNGYQLCQSVRANKSFAGTPIIFMTGKASPKDKEYARRIGANAFLTKPFEMEELVERCLSFTRKPGFQVRPKKMSVYEIHANEFQEKQSKKLREWRFDRLDDKG